DGDLLGDDPHGAWAAASADLLTALDEPGVADRQVSLSFGMTPAVEYLSQMTTDKTIHTWDLARGTGGDDQLDPELVEWVSAYMAPHFEEWRSGGAFGPTADVPAGADAQTTLLANTGRQA